MKKDLTGQTFGRLTVLQRDGSIQENENVRRAVWLCKCACGETVRATTRVLTSGGVRSCGCLFKETASKNCSELRTKHGLTKDGGDRATLYAVWKGIRGRCYSKTSHAYKNYGGRGIEMCKEWRDDPTAFVEWCLSNGYKKGLDIDRINVNGNYEPSNCRFITRGENSKNRRCVKHLTIMGVIRTASEWGRMIGYSHSSLSRIIRREGSDAAILRVKEMLYSNTGIGGTL